MELRINVNEYLAEEEIKEIVKQKIEEPEVLEKMIEKVVETIIQRAIDNFCNYDIESFVKKICMDNINKLSGERIDERVKDVFEKDEEFIDSIKKSIKEATPQILLCTITNTIGNFVQNSYFSVSGQIQEDCINRIRSIIGS